MTNLLSASKLNKTYGLALTALLFAMALVLSTVEMMLPPIPMMVPGVKFGLANIVVMYALFFVGKSSAGSIVILKAGFVMFMRGGFAGFLSLCGGLMSLLVMILLICIFKEKISYLIISILGAIFHNIGQFAAISLVYTNLYLWVYMPVLLVSGVLAGITTAAILKVILPALQKLSLR